MKTPKRVYVFPNGMCMVFDNEGEQIPELQGKYEDKRHEIAKVQTEGTEFIYDSWEAFKMRRNGHSGYQ